MVSKRLLHDRGELSSPREHLVQPGLCCHFFVSSRRTRGYSQQCLRWQHIQLHITKADVLSRSNEWRNYFPASSVNTLSVTLLLSCALWAALLAPGADTLRRWLVQLTRQKHTPLMMSVSAECSTNKLSYNRTRSPRAAVQRLRLSSVNITVWADLTWTKLAKS